MCRSTPAMMEMLGVAAESLKPSERMGVAEWSDKHRYLPATESARPGKWETSFVPYLKGVMDAMTDASVRTIVFKAASQVAKTAFLMGAALWAIDCDPGPMMFVYPTDRLAEGVNQDRFIPCVKACPRVRARLRSESPREMGASHVRFDRCTVWWMGSNSTANVKSRPIRYIFGDEIDDEAFDLSAIPLMEQRTKTYPRAKHVYSSTPGLSGNGIDGMYQSSDRRTYWVPCPHCSEFTTLKWSMVKWVGGRDANQETVEKEAWLECPCCKGRIENADKPAMLERGVWLKEGQTVDREGQVHGEGRGGDVAGFTISALYSPVLKFGATVRAFLKAGARATQEWVTGWLGEAWEEIGDKVDEAELKRLCVSVKDGGYRMVAPGSKEKMPPGVLCLAGSIDLQRDRAYMEIRGFGEYGRDSWLIWHGKLRCPMDDPKAMSRLDALMRAKFLHADGTPLSVAAWAVDSGDGFRTHEVYEWTKDRPTVYAAKGRGSDTMKQPHELQMLKIGEPRGEGGPERRKRFAHLVGQTVKYFTINSGFWKDYVLGLIKRSGDAAALDSDGLDIAAVVGGVGDEGSMGSSEAARGGRMYLPEDCGDEYMDQLASEHKCVKTVNGRRVMVWSRRPGKEDNHYFDTCTQACALADAMGVMTVTSAMAEARRAKARAAAEAEKAKKAEPEKGKAQKRTEPGFVGAGQWSIT